MLAGQSAEDALKRVDRFRYPWPSFSVEVSLRDGKVTQRWKVLVRENGDARVEGLSEKEQGRTVLLLKDQMWLLLPTAKRPVKVSPQQRLLGPAAGGDVARFRFSGEYTVTEEREEAQEGRPCRRLDLQAKRPDLGFRTTTLWISREGTPIRADFFFASGKPARTVQFGPLTSAHGVQVLSGLVLLEPSGKRVELQFAEWNPIHPEDRLFRLPEENE